MDPNESVHAKSARNTSPLRIATVIPVYRAEISEIEKRRVERTLQNVSRDAVFFIGPDSWRGFKDAKFLQNFNFVPFAKQSFSSLSDYNRFMLQPDLYVRFIQYEFVLVCQLDAFLVKSLPVTDALDFDYVGAPWVPPWQVRWSPMRRRMLVGRSSGRSKELHVGNGGLSLRRTSRFAQLRKLPPFRKFPNEDIAISYFNRWLGIEVAPVTVARNFFMETGARSWVPGDAIPAVIGFHGLNRHNPLLEAQILND